MKENKLKNILWTVGTLVVVFVIAVFALSFVSQRQFIVSQAANTNFTYATTTISAPNGTIIAQISDTIDKQTQGLSDRTSLPQGTGMLFVFDSPSPQYMWMKDMEFPLDIVWLDANKRVVHIETNLSPNTYRTNPPQIFYSPTPASFVIELPANDATRLGIVVGTTLKF